MNQEKWVTMATRERLGIPDHQDLEENQVHLGKWVNGDHRDLQGHRDPRVFQETSEHQGQTGPWDQRVFKETEVPRDHQGQKEQREMKALQAHLEILVPLADTVGKV